MVLQTDVAGFRKHPELAEEVFGPFALIIAAGRLAELVIWSPPLQSSRN